MVAPYATRDGADGRARRPPARTCSGWPTRAWRAATATTRPSTTRRRGCRAGETSAVVRSYMAHHQGMSLLALAYLLLDQPMQRRFEADPQLQATLLLLQERMPEARCRSTRTRPTAPTCAAAVGRAETPLRLITTPDTPSPEVQLLSNGRYHVMLTNAGGGYSRWKDLAVTRWREDATCDAWGSFCYLRDTETGTFWSTHAASRRTGSPDSFEAIFTEGRAEFRRRDQGIDAYTEIVVSPEDDIEAAPPAPDQPAAARGAASSSPATPRSCWRRARPTRSTRRSASCSCRPSCCRPAGAAVHAPPALGRGAVAVDAPPDGGARRHGRARRRTRPTARASSAAAAALACAAGAARRPRPLSGTAGLGARPGGRDPARRHAGARADRDRRHRLRRGRDARGLPGAGAQDMPTGAWPTACSSSPGRTARSCCASSTPARPMRRLYARLASAVVYSQPTLRADAATLLLRNRRGQSGLWGYGSRATCRSCCCRSATPPTSTWCGRWCRRTPGGDSRAWRSTW